MASSVTSTRRSSSARERWCCGEWSVGPTRRTRYALAHRATSSCRQWKTIDEGSDVETAGRICSIATL